MKTGRWGSKSPRSTVLSPEEEVVCVALRKHTLWGCHLDGCLYTLQASIAHLTRSSLHRLFQRHSISRLPDLKGEAVPKKEFKTYPIGYFHIDIAEVRTEEGKLRMFVAIDRASTFVFVKLEEKANRKTASAFLEELIAAVPYKIHAALTVDAYNFAKRLKELKGAPRRSNTSSNVGPKSRNGSLTNLSTTCRD